MRLFFINILKSICGNMSFGDQCVGLYLRGGPFMLLFFSGAPPARPRLSKGSCRQARADSFLSRRVTNPSRIRRHSALGRIRDRRLSLGRTVWVKFAAGCVYPAS